MKTIKKVDDIEDANNPSNDDSDIIEEAQLQYDENIWWTENQPLDYSLKGWSKDFTEAVESIKSNFKKGNQKVLDDTEIKILDRREKANGPEFEIELKKDKERGIASLKVFGPNTKNECTLVINKVRKQDIKYVKILAEDVLKKLLNMFISGQGWSMLLKSKETSNNKNLSKRPSLEKIRSCLQKLRKL